MNIFKRNLFDREEVWTHYWVEMGESRSFIKLSKWLKSSKGVINPETGREITPMGLWFALWRWAVKNPEKSRIIANKGISSSGRFFTEDEWKSILDDKSKVVYSWKRDNA